MKVNLIKALTVGAILSGCAHTQTQVPYHVAKVTDHESRLLPIQFPLGITQEKLGEKQYRVTAKLAEFGTHKRARSMALYHASLLAEQEGYDAFIINSSKMPSWCGSSINKKTKFIGDVNGGTTSKLIITLVQAENVGNKKLFIAQKTKILNKVLIDKVPTKLELEQISSERLELCKRRAGERSARR